jgi:hypothetical protein
MVVTAEGANYTREDASLEWASSSVNVSTQQVTERKGRTRKVATRAGIPTGAPMGVQGDAGGRHTIHAVSQPAPPRQGPAAAPIETQFTHTPQAAPGTASSTPKTSGEKRVTPVLVSSFVPPRGQAHDHDSQSDPLHAGQERLMNLGRRIKRAEQAEARQNAVFEGATTLREEPPAPFEEDFGAAFAADLRKPTADLNEEAEVGDDIAISSDECEARLSVTWGL